MTFCLAGWRGYSDDDGVALSSPFSSEPWVGSRFQEQFPGEFPMHKSFGYVLGPATNPTLFHVEMMHHIDRKTDKYNPDIRSLCQYSECLTSNNKPCKFPFRYKGRRYDTCITVDSESPWCSLDIDVYGNHVDSDSSRGTCQKSCHVQNCPIGFFMYKESCYLISARTNSDRLYEIDDGEKACNDHGTTLYKPRSFKSFDNMLDTFHQYLRPEKQHYPTLKSHPEDFSFTRIDGKKSESGFTFTDGSLGYMLEMRFIEDGSSNLDSGQCFVINQQGKVVTKNCGHYHSHYVGYLCQAKLEKTINGPDANNTCKIPFKTSISEEPRYSCFYSNDTSQPWCATENDADGVMIPEKWGNCKDERITTYDGDGDGSPCILPFLHDRIWRDKCSKSGGKLWCPTNLTKPMIFNEAIDKIGYCTDYLNPSSSGCPPYYAKYRSSCIRVSPYAESHQNASDKCISEGSNLISVDSESLTMFLFNHIKELEQNKVYFQPQYSPDISSYWIGGEVDNQKWSWAAKEKTFLYTNWKDKKENSGCLSLICTNNYALTLNTKRHYTWEAVDKSNVKPYICESKCKDGFTWFEGLKRCIFISDLSTPVSFTTAIYQCSVKDGHLLQFKKCEEIDEVSLDLWKLTGKDYIEFWVGYYGGNLDHYDALRISQATRESVKIITSTGYNNGNLCPKMELQDFTSDEFNAVLNSGNHTRDDVKMQFLPYTKENTKDYLCEKNEEWTCPEGFIIFQEECYSFNENEMSFTEAGLHCHTLNSHLAEPMTKLHDLFLLQGISSKFPRLKAWTGFRKNINTSSIETFFSSRTLAESPIQFDSLSGNSFTFLFSLFQLKG